MDRKFYRFQLIKRIQQRAAGFLTALWFIIFIAPEPYCVQVAFLGDVMLGRGIAQAAARNSDWRPFEALQPFLHNSDIVAANLESPLTNAPIVTEGYALCAPPEQSTSLSNAGFDLLSIANNHVLDCGEIGLEQSQLILQSIGLRTVGPNPQPVYLEKHGRQIAFIAMDDVSQPIQLSATTQIIQTASWNSDVVILSIHWGAEYQPAPSKHQQNLAAELVNAGADVIIGHHPHIIQPVDILVRREDGTQALVFYSLGNALFDQHGLKDTRIGTLVMLFILPNGKLQFATHQFMIDPREGLIQTIISEI